MERLWALILGLTGSALAVRMFVQARRGTVDTLALRNFFNVGMVLFVLLSGVFTLGFDFYPELHVSDASTAGAIFTVLTLAFMAIFSLTYRSGVIADRLAGKVRSKYTVSGPIPMLVLSTVFLVAALACKFLLGLFPFFGLLGAMLATGLSAAAAGMAAWAWAPRPFNVAVGSFAAGVIFVALGIALFRAFGRRDVVSVMLAIIWGAYHGHWRHIGLKRALYQIVPLAVAGVLLLGSFTGARVMLQRQHLGFVESFTRATQGDVGSGLFSMVAQDTASCSLWLIETRPDPFPYDTLHSLRYFLTHPIPRIYWEGKPNALGIEMTKQGQVRRKAAEFNFGPGLPGHLMNDNPWISLPLYAFGIAVLLRLMDRVVALNPLNPFLVIPMGVTAGEILALPRGELGLFMFRTVVAVAGAWVGMSICAAITTAIGMRAAMPASGEDGAGETGGEGSGPAREDRYDLYGEGYDDPGSLGVPSTRA